YLPPRHHRSLGQHGVGDAERWLAAEFAGHSRTRFLPRHTAADFVARRALAVEPRARQAAAQHLIADPRLERRRTLDGVRHAGRRRPGPVVDAAFPAP